MKAVPVLPTINASLNALSGIFLTLGFVFIKAKNQKWHARMMIFAFLSSIIFLSSYLYYHFTVRLVTHYQGQGILRPIYFFILLTHIPLAALIPPFALLALWFAHKKNFERHTQITRILWPVWMYVSLTGVLVYLMLYIF